MRIRLLGTAAGGGFPQWNCNCACCRLARTDPARARPRTQSSVAVSGAGVTWFLLNCSPDVRPQIESFPPLLPRDGETRGSSIEGVLLTDADLDHTLGLLILREGPRPMPVYAMPAVMMALRDHLRVDAVLSNYAGIEWRLPPIIEAAPLRLRDGTDSVLLASAFVVPGTGPRYAQGPGQSVRGAVVGYRIRDESTGDTLAYVPHVAELDDIVMRHLHDCHVLLLDGTCWSDDEMRVAGVSDMTARAMGHLPVGGPDGSLRAIAPLPALRKIYVHLNNTNPMLIEDSPERREVEAHGVEIGYDGMEIEI